LEPENVDGWLDHADLLLQMKGPDLAARKLKEGSQVIKLTSKYAYRMVSYLLRMGDMQQALVLLEDALMNDHSSHTLLLEHYPLSCAVATGHPPVGTLPPIMNYTLSHIPARSAPSRVRMA
jgi:hypothetical protein